MSEKTIFSLTNIPKHPPLFSGAHKVKAAILASGTGSNFRVILEKCSAGELQIEPVGLLCNIEGAGCLKIADEYKIPSVLIKHKDYASREAFDQKVVEQLKEWGCDLVIMAGWMRIATPILIDAYRDRITNLHPSLLPSFRGLHAIEQAYEAGVGVTGCSVHLVSEELDDGPILGQAALAIEATDTVETLTQRIHAAEHVLYPKAIQHYIDTKTEK